MLLLILIFIFKKKNGHVALFNIVISNSDSSHMIPKVPIKRCLVDESQSSPLPPFWKCQHLYHSSLPVILRCLFCSFVFVFCAIYHFTFFDLHLFFNF